MYVCVHACCHKETGPPILVPAVQIYRNIWTPWIIYFNFAEIFGPPEQKFLKYLDLLEIFYPPLFELTHGLTDGL